MMVFIHETAFVEENATVGEGTKVWHFVQIRSNAKVGNNCNIGKGVYIDQYVKIGNNVKIQNFVSVYKGVVIEDDVFIGPSVTFTNDPNPRAFLWDENRIVPTIVRQGSSIGANATIVAGTTIGEFAMIGAGAVVTKDVPSHGLFYGNPAQLRGYVCRCGKKLLATETEIHDSEYSCECGYVIRL